MTATLALIANATSSAATSDQRFNGQTLDLIAADPCAVLTGDDVLDGEDVRRPATHQLHALPGRSRTADVPAAGCAVGSIPSRSRCAR